jgi:hypothetical protein
VALITPITPRITRITEDAMETPSHMEIVGKVLKLPLQKLA